MPISNGFGSSVISTLTVAVTVAGAFWGVAVVPLTSRLDRMESNEDTFRVTLAEYREFHAKTDATLDRIQQEQSRRRDLFVTQLDHAKIETAIARLDSELSKIRDSEVTRGEHTQKWASDAATFATLQRQIDEIKKEFGSSYSLNDKIKELQAELNDLRKTQR